MAQVNIGSEVSGIVGALERKNPRLAVASRIRAAWNRVAPERARGHVTGVFVVPNTGNGEVVVYTDAPIWAGELNMQAELMRLKLNLELERMGGTSAARGSEQVKKLRFAASKKEYLPTESREGIGELLQEEDRALQGVEKVPLSREEERALRDAAAGVEDERLREAGYAAAKASLEWQHGLEAARHGK